MSLAKPILPQQFPRRSFLYRELAAQGAEFGGLGDAAIALRFSGDSESEIRAARHLAIADLSPLPRSGFKGRGTIDWLIAQGLTIGEESNNAYRQAGGEWAARLAPNEIFLLDSLAGSGELIGRLETAWRWEEAINSPQGYPMPRRESHAWFLVSGEHSAAMFSKICGIDLRPAKFAAGRIAQTSLAKMSAILIRTDLGATLAFHVLADSAAASYLWAALLDAMREFDGHPVGIEALRHLAA